MIKRNKKLSLLILFAFFLISFFIFPIIHTYAAGLVPCGDTPDDPCTVEDFFELIRNVLDYIWKILAPILALLWFGFAGYKMMLSQGDPGKFNEGKNMLLYGIIGIIIIFSAPIIVEAFLDLVGAIGFAKFFFQ